MEKVVSKYKLGEEPTNDLAYWLEKTPLERIQALEQMRQQYIEIFMPHESQQRLQRVCRIVKQKSS
ncbi:MAG: hypothetical protein ACI85I_001233 [Arenicella sp.]|jgi:hypothetical protein